MLMSSNSLKNLKTLNLNTINDKENQQEEKHAINYYFILHEQLQNNGNSYYSDI